MARAAQHVALVDLAGDAVEGPDAAVIALARAVVALEAADQALATAWADDAEAAPPREFQRLQLQVVRAARRLQARLARQRPTTAAGVRAMAAAAIAAPGDGNEALARAVCRAVVAQSAAAREIQDAAA